MSNPILEQGPVPKLVHGMIEYVVGALLIVAPLVLGYEADAAVAVSVIAGIVVLAVAAVTEGAPGLIDLLPLEFHVVVDLILSIFLIVTPFVFGFSGETEPTAFFIVLGVAHLLLTFGTRFRSEPSVGS